MNDEKISLVENFNRFFSVDLALTPEQKRSVFAIRYRVYCEELKLEPAHEGDQGLEFDEFDDKSLHCLVTHRRTGVPAGCVRLVTTRDNMYDDPLPMEKYCLDSLSIQAAERLNANRHRVCEISRLAVDPLFRRRAGEQETQYGQYGALDCCHRERRAFSLVAVAGFVAGAALTELTGRTDIFAMMNPFLPRLLKRSGILFKRAGADMDYRGIRAPYYTNTQVIHEHMRAELTHLYDTIFRRFESACHETLYLERKTA
jgi:N-acyl amino acid synthase of PEP-CTERM/exosortase system